MIVGIVAEGKTDFIVLKEYIESWWSAQGFDEKIIVRSLQPTVDATSGEWGDGGWTYVKAWCEENSPSMRISQIFSPLFAHETPCDALLVHLDGDVLEEYVRATPSVSIPKIALDKHLRADLILKILDAWLWPKPNEKTKAFSFDAHIKLPAIQSTEAWLLAGLDRTIADPEEVDTEVEFLLRYPELAYVKRGRKRLKKDPKRWEEFAKLSSKHIVHIRRKCIQLENLFVKLSAISVI